MLKRILQSLIGSRRLPAERFHDPRLGELLPGETGWTVQVTKEGESFAFTIGGQHQPDAALLAHARDIADNYAAFKKAVRDCIDSESRDYPDEVKAELSQLSIDNISLTWPARPDDGMIFFRGPADDSRLWRCDYINRKPTGLGCDT